MTKNTIVLEKREIEKRIGKNFGGGVGSFGWAYYLIIRRNGGYRIAACEEVTWLDNDYVVALPAPFGDGRSELSELAEEMLEAEGIEPEIEEGPITAAERLAPEIWEEWKNEALAWYADEWIRALNNEPNDLGINEAFGVREVFEPEHDIFKVAPPFRFEWK
jgi:hypothetical protein